MSAIRIHRDARRRTVLVCDAEDVVRLLVGAALDPLGCAVVEARDGVEALTQVGVEHPDLIILDLMMPGRSGWEVLTELRSDPATAGTPVIVLTARAQDADRAAGIAAGADDYLTKPFRPMVLAGLVGELLA